MTPDERRDAIAEELRRATEPVLADPCRWPYTPTDPSEWWKPADDVPTPAWWTYTFAGLFIVASIFTGSIVAGGVFLGLIGDPRAWVAVPCTVLAGGAAYMCRWYQKKGF